MEGLDKINTFTNRDMVNSPFYKVPIGENIYIPRINLIQKSGFQFSLPYPYLGAILLESDTITINETQHIIEIKGRCLEKLYEFLVNHKVTSVKEAESEFDEIENQVFVQKISINKTQ